MPTQKNSSSFENAQKHFNFIDIFSGAGGLSCGMEMNGWRCLLGVDIDKHAMRTFAHNHHHASVHCQDIAKLTNSELKRLTNQQTIHAVVGGPPCQGFSTVGRGNPKDARNKLFLEFIRIVETTRPWFVVMENVTGLLAKKNSKTLEAIFHKFAELGYHMDVRILSAEDFGVPERRRRTIFIGTLLNVPVAFPVKFQSPPKTVGDALLKLEKATSNVTNHDVKAAAIKNKLDCMRIARIPEGKGIRYPEDEAAFFKSAALKLNINWSKLPEGRFRQTKYQRLNRALPSPTIMTHRHSYYHPTENRYLTAREAACLQSFPLNFEFQGPLSAQWRQIGNAVPPLLGKAIAQALNNMIQMAAKKSTPKKSISRQKRDLDTYVDEVRGKAFDYKA